VRLRRGKGVQKAEGAAAAPPPLLRGRCACDSNINPHTLHLDFAHDQAPAPGGGSEARQSTAGRGTNQPDACADAQGKRMEARCGGAVCARESVLVGGVRRRAPLRRNGDRLNHLRPSANPNRHTGFCSLLGRVSAALRVHGRGSRPPDHRCNSKATILWGSLRGYRTRRLSRGLASDAP
jgi:hypothetical protein